VADVRSVEDLGGTRFRLFHDPGFDPTEALVRASVEEDWGLAELTPVETSLEEVFVQLTQGEEESPAAPTPDRAGP
jgi:ABC-2 type transport system ATP-binding protein